MSQKICALEELNISMSCKCKRPLWLNIMEGSYSSYVCALYYIIQLGKIWCGWDKCVGRKRSPSEWVGENNIFWIFKF